MHTAALKHHLAGCRSGVAGNRDRFPLSSTHVLMIGDCVLFGFREGMFDGQSRSLAPENVEYYDGLQVGFHRGLLNVMLKVSALSAC